MEDRNELSVENPPKTIKYVRRADRTPEKDFREKSEDEKKHVCVTRSAVGRVRNKITQLEDAIDERDKEIDKEKELRKEAEAKLQSHMTDMYKNPKVNQELRDRLPRANKSDPFKTEEESETDLSSIEEQIVTEEESETSASQPPMRSEVKWGAEGQPNGNVTDSTTPSNSRRRIDFTGDAMTSKVNTETQTNGLERSPTFPFTNFSPSLGYFGANPYTPFNPYQGNSFQGNSLQGNSLPGTFQSPFLRSNLLSPASFARPSSSPLLNPTLNPSFSTQSALQEPTISKVLTSNTFAPPPFATSSGETTTTLPREATSALPREATSLSGAMGGQSLFQPGLDSGAMAGMRSFLPTQSSPLHTSVLPDPFLPSASQRLQMSSSVHPDQSKQIAVLINEIDSHRAEVKKMRQSLADKDLEIGMLKVTLNAQDVEQQVSKSDKHADQAAGLVEEVYTAQKMRDDATSKRIQVASDERDDIMARLRELEARFEAQSNRAVLNHPDESLMDEDLLDLEEINLMSPSSGDNNRSSGLFRRVESMKERQREVMKEELQIVMEQRDMALARCHKLESELLRYQKESDADGGMDKNLKAKLATVQQERDMAVAKSKQLDDEIQTIRIYYSLYKSFSGENTVQQPSNHTVPANVQEELKSSRQEVEQVLGQSNRLAEENNELKKQLQMHTIDKKQLQQALESVTQEKERFQRLARVLRRKLDSLTDENKTTEEKE